MTERFAEGFAGSSTAELVSLEAGGTFALQETWADSLFYGAVGLVGGIGPPVIKLKGTVPLRNEAFHRPPPEREGSHGAVGMTFEFMSFNGKPVCYHLSDEEGGFREAAVDGRLADLVLIAAHTRLVKARGRCSFPQAPWEDYLMCEIGRVSTVRPLWVSWNRPC